MANITHKSTASELETALKGIKIKLEDGKAVDLGNVAKADRDWTWLFIGSEDFSAKPTEEARETLRQMGFRCSKRRNFRWYHQGGTGKAPAPRKPKAASGKKKVAKKVAKKAPKKTATPVNPEVAAVVSQMSSEQKAQLLAALTA